MLLVLRETLALQAQRAPVAPRGLPQQWLAPQVLRELLALLVRGGQQAQLA